jgi:hypothetical protein
MQPVAIPLVPNELDKHFANISRQEIKMYASDRAISFKVTNEFGSDAGDITYLGEGEWRIYVDNFPSQKKYFATNLPMKTVDQFAADVARTGLKLIPV